MPSKKNAPSFERVTADGDETTMLRPTGETRSCGWCGHPTRTDPCGACGHEDPDRPWRQRGQEPPVVRTDATGRPGLDARAIRKRLSDARTAIGPDATAAEIAEHLDVSVRTLGRWQKVAR